MILLTRKEAAEYLKVSMPTMNLWAQTGYGPPHINLSTRASRYPLDQMNEWLEARMVTKSTDISE